MTQKELYKYERADGKYTVTPDKNKVPIGVEVELMARLIADEGKELVHAITGQTAFVIDTTIEDVPNWAEQDAPPEPEIITE